MSPSKYLIGADASTLFVTTTIDIRANIFNGRVGNRQSANLPTSHLKENIPKVAGFGWMLG